LKIIICVIVFVLLTDGLLPTAYPSWQDAYAALLRQSSHEAFYLVDIDNDGIPELLIGGQMPDWTKYAEYYVYTYKNNIAVYIGNVSTLSSSHLWTDKDNGILGYEYGAGEGGTIRFYIDSGAIQFDDTIQGYFYDRDGNFTVWFRGADGSMVIVTKETEDEYLRILNSQIELESHAITEDNIEKIIYGERLH
jgi:hypothetical protein